MDDLVRSGDVGEGLSELRWKLRGGQQLSRADCLTVMGYGLRESLLESWGQRFDWTRDRRTLALICVSPEVHDPLRSMLCVGDPFALQGGALEVLDFVFSDLSPPLARAKRSLLQARRAVAACDREAFQAELLQLQDDILDPSRPKDDRLGALVRSLECLCRGLHSDLPVDYQAGVAVAASGGLLEAIVDTCLHPLTCFVSADSVGLREKRATFSDALAGFQSELDLVRRLRCLMLFEATRQAFAYLAAAFAIRSDDIAGLTRLGCLRFVLAEPWCESQG